MGRDSAAAPPVVHLHAHSYFSLLDGASSPEALAHRVAELGQDALALTDWGLYGAVLFARACRSVGVRPLHGAEIALTDGRHLTLLCRDATGWRSLCRLLTRAQLEGRKGHAPVRPELLADNAAGLICLSGCRHGAVAAPLLVGDTAGAWRAARWLQGVFGDDLWIELPRHRLPGERLLTHRLARLAGRLGAGTVASANVHYATPEQAPLADVLACVRAGTTLRAARSRRHNDRYHLADGAELRARFADLPEALANTALVAQRCTFALDFGRHVFPAVPLPAGRTPERHLRALCRAGVTERYADGDPAAWRQAIRQLDDELGVIADLGLAPYFLFVHDVVRHARERGIAHQGRGSAAGSVVSYALGIARVDPLAHGLLFERFLSRERGTPPDIDLDVSHERREELIQYVYRTYGEAQVAMACTFQRYHLRGAVRDLGKVLGLPAPLLATRSARVRHGLDDTLEQAVAAVAGDGAPDSPLWRTFIALATALVGVPRHVGLHNGGLVVTAGPLGELVPLERAAKPGRVAVQFDKESLELAGLIKLDLLGNQGLDLVHEAVELAARHEGRRLDLARLPLDDPAVYDLLRRADTIGCWQVESRAQQQFLPLHAPRSFGDLVNQISIIRPGPIQSGMVHPYLRRRTGEEAVSYPHPLLEPVLRATLGVILFQEDVLEVARVLAGFSLGKADELRRALRSQRGQEQLAALHERFLAGARATGVEEAAAIEVWRQLAAFAEYGFPRSHAVAFARLAYETAYLKLYHPLPFFAARLNAVPGGFYPPAVVVGDARRHGVTVLGPDLARSEYRCTIEGGAIRLGLRYVRGVAEATGASLVAERDRGGAFRDLGDLCRRCHRFLPPEAIAALIGAGACDPWGQPRRHLLWSLPAAWRAATGLPLPVAPVDLPEETTLERLASEGWATGLPLGGHVMATQRAALDGLGVLPLAALAGVPAGRRVTVAGRVVIRQQPPTARGAVFVTLEDEGALANLTFSPAAYRRCRERLHAAPLLLATGQVQRRGRAVNLQVAEVEPWWPQPMQR